MVTTIYMNEDPYASLDDLKAAIPEAWDMPPLGAYIDEDGTVTPRPPLNQKIKIKKLSELLLARVEGYQ